MKHSMLCVAGVYLRGITNTFFPILYLNVSHLSIGSSCYLLLFFDGWRLGWQLIMYGVPFWFESTLHSIQSMLQCTVFTSLLMTLAWMYQTWGVRLNCLWQIAVADNGMVVWWWNGCVIMNWLCDDEMVLWWWIGCVMMNWLCENEVVVWWWNGCVIMNFFYDEEMVMRGWIGCVMMNWLCDNELVVWLRNGYVIMNWLCDNELVVWWRNGYVMMNWLCDGELIVW